MRINIPKLIDPRNLSARAKLIVAAGVIVASTSTVAAINAFTPSTAEQMSPTEIKVVEHEERLDKNEADITETKDRVTEVEQKTDENAQAIGQTNQRVTVVERKTETVVQQQTAPQSAPNTPTPTPQVDPYTITSVVPGETPNSINPGNTDYSCTYALQNGERYRIVETLPTSAGFSVCELKLGQIMSPQMRQVHARLS